MPGSTVEPQEQRYSEALAALTDITPQVLKHDDSFAILDRQGRMQPLGRESHGLFRDDTRFLSRLVLTVDGRTPALLSSGVDEDALMLYVDLSKPAAETGAGGFVANDTLHLRQTVLLCDHTLYVRIVISNYGLEAASVSPALHFDADFADIFEVRGIPRQQRGTLQPAQVEAAAVRLTYRGLDEVERRTGLSFSPQPTVLSADHAEFEIRLEPKQQFDLLLTVTCAYDGEAVSPVDFDAAYARRQALLDRHTQAMTRLTSDDTQFNRWLDASQRDLFFLLTDTEHGLYPYAGTPWFSTVFGRDGLITALQTLAFYPEIARGVLTMLAATQATESDAYRDAEPGKIMHERRRGEMANRREVPFGAYYGTVDATPLFLVLAGRYYEQTGDLAFVEGLWPTIEAALDWIDRFGDVDGDGFVEYRRKTETGIVQQGWKDSDDSVFYADGRLVRPPVALCEVQGYVYEGKRLAADIADALRRQDTARRLRAQADTLRTRFIDAFWVERLGTYALALDGDKQPCAVRSSNAGHCLYTGIADAGHAQQMVEQFLDSRFFTGWGIRTIADGEARYNPMSYHNGTVWPHDNALIAAGMARYGYKAAAASVLQGVFQASLSMDLYRLPELFCGFTRHGGEGPVRYPVACLPQAWAAASVFMMLQACLGLTIDGRHGRVRVEGPVMPPSLHRLRLDNLRVGTAAVDLEFAANGRRVEVDSVRQTGNVEVSIG